MRPLGTITRLQIQLNSLKAGLPQQRYYTPTPIRMVPELVVSEGGVTASDGTGNGMMDIHHRDHPESKQSRKGINAISVGFSTHYDAMRGRFGAHMTDGIAGENILVRTDGAISDEDLAEGLVIQTADGRDLLLQRLLVAEPCVEFTRYALRYPPDARSDEAVTEAIEFLRRGLRGFYATYRGEPISVRQSDRVYLAGD